MMSLSRRGLLGSLLGAPAVITTPGLLMPVWDRTPILWGDGIHDDTEGMHAFLNDLPFKRRPNYIVSYSDSPTLPIRRCIVGGEYKLKCGLTLSFARTSMWFVRINNVDHSPAIYKNA